MKIACKLVFILMLLLTACSQKPAGPASDALTIRPLPLSEREKTIVEKTGIPHIEYSYLNGTLQENEDLLFEIASFENGEFTEPALETSEQIKTNFKNEIISFGVFDDKTEEEAEKETIILNLGVPDGLVSGTTYSHKMTATLFSGLINEEISLTKNQPVYLAIWARTNKNPIHSFSKNGELPDRLDQFETAFLFKVTLVDKE